MMGHTCVVIGGGFAGLSTAVRLAQKGLTPLVLERRPVLGGRACSFVHDDTSTVVDNGQHVLMRCCHSVRSFLDTIGSDTIHFEDGFSIPFIDSHGRRHRLNAPGWLPPKLGLMVAFLRFGPTSWRDAVSLGRAMPYLRTLPQDLTVSGWLNRINQSDPMRTNFWHPLCLSVLNAAPDVAPARELLVVLAEALSVPSGASMGWSTVGLSSLYTEQASRYIRERGGKIRRSTFVTNLDISDGATILMLRDQSILEAESVVLAVPPPRVADILANTGQDDLLTRLAAHTPSPILSVNLWFDREILPEPFVGLLGGTMEWVFNREAILSSEGSDHHLSLAVSASTALASKSDEELVDLALQDLRGAKLIAGDERPLHTLIVHEKRATYVRPVGSNPVSPMTSHPAIFLAGDWTDTGLPPTIESAVRSGTVAANLVEAYLQKEKPEP